jgi:hypothetical protein
MIVCRISVTCDCIFGEYGVKRFIPPFLLPLTSFPEVLNTLNEDGVQVMTLIAMSARILRVY